MPSENTMQPVIRPIRNMLKTNLRNGARLKNVGNTNVTLPSKCEINILSVCLPEILFTAPFVLGNSPHNLKLLAISVAGKGKTTITITGIVVSIGLTFFLFVASVIMILRTHSL